MQRPTENQLGILGVCFACTLIIFLVFFRLLGGHSFLSAVFWSFIVGLVVCAAIYLFLMTTHGMRMVESGAKRVAATASDTRSIISAKFDDESGQDLKKVVDRVRQSGSAFAGKLTGSDAPEPPEKTQEPKENEVETSAMPKGLSSSAGADADDLKRIKGVGPKLEQELHALGYFHFHQIASWTDENVAWIDENLSGVRGSASRDNWVAQAKALASENQA